MATAPSPGSLYGVPASAVVKRTASGSALANLKGWYWTG
jgi:hypothetical protein